MWKEAEEEYLKVQYNHSICSKKGMNTAKNLSQGTSTAYPDRKSSLGLLEYE
jgi:hypothetical protein